MANPSRYRPFPSLLLLGLALCAAPGCSSSDDEEPLFVVAQTTHASASSTPPVVFGDWIVYFADEATSGISGGATFQDLNGDGDTNDPVAVARNSASGATTVLAVAAETAGVIGNEVYVVVDEARDAVDWNSDADMVDFVIVHWSSAAGLPPVFVDELPVGGEAHPLEVVDGRLYYPSAEAPAGADDTALKMLTTTAPLVGAPVQHAEGGQLHPRLLGADEKLLFLLLDETVDGDLNGDGDATDANVLALLNADLESGEVKSTGLALSAADVPFAAVDTGTDDWVAAFLVSEAGQAVNLNDPALFSPTWVVSGCPSTDDGDMTDDVLHYLHFASWFADPVLSPPVNTGLAGGDRVLAFQNTAATREFVATLVDEADAGCNLNLILGDADMTDRIPRWVEAVVPPAPMLPPSSQALMRAVLPNLPGDSFGMGVVEGHLVIAVDEDANDESFDADLLETHVLAAIADPTDVSPTWDFTHVGSAINFGTGIAGKPYAGVSWMAEETQTGRLGVGFQEVVPAMTLNTNFNCAFVIKDADITDSLPVWVDVEENSVLDFDGVGYAVATNNAGIVVSKGIVFFRVNEANDNFAYNEGGLGDKLDDILFRNPINACGPFGMGTSTSDSGPVVITDGLTTAAFLSSEAQSNGDINGDGDATDIVVRYFRF